MIEWRNTMRACSSSFPPCPTPLWLETLLEVVGPSSKNGEANTWDGCELGFEEE